MPWCKHSSRDDLSWTRLKFDKSRGLWHLITLIGKVSRATKQQVRKSFSYRRIVALIIFIQSSHFGIPETYAKFSRSLSSRERKSFRSFIPAQIDAKITKRISWKLFYVMHNEYQRSQRGSTTLSWMLPVILYNRRGECLSSPFLRSHATSYCQSSFIIWRVSS